jgi:aspartate 1-decarboxylase
MLRCMLRAKIHNATVTEADIKYEGSLTVDESLLAETGIMPYEQVQISNLNNGERFETYVIPGPSGSGVICLNGPTDRKGEVGDKIIVFTYCYIQEEDMKEHSPKIILLDKENRIKG